MIRLALVSLLLVASAPVEKGSLRLTSLPGVEVEWEGIGLGETGADGALWIRDIPPGDYGVTLSKPGYRSLTRQLTITDGETSVSLGLERLPSRPVAEPPAAAAPRPEPPPKPEPKSASATSPPPAAGPVQEPPVPVARRAPAMDQAPVSRAGASEDNSSEGVGAARLLLLAVLVLFAALALAISRAARQRAATKRRRPSHRRERREPRSAAAPPPPDEPPGFLRDLQRRETHVDSGAPEVIDVIDVEIIDDES